MTRNKSIALIASVAAAVLALGVSACGGSDNNATAATPASTTTPATTGSSTVNTASSSSLGTILVDAQGNTLYAFGKDSPMKSACFGACATNWPPLRSVKPTGATASMLGTIPRSDGKPQVTYNGLPLYTFSADQAPGDTNGQGVTAFGGIWYVVSPDGNTVTTPASSSSSSSSSSGSLGY